MISTPITGNAAARSNSQIFSLRLAKSMSNHAGLSYSTFSAGRARRTLWVLAALLLLATAPRVGWGQAVNTIVYDGNNTHCGSECCQEFTITINEATDTVDIILGAWDDTGIDTATDCFDHTCWASQGDLTETFEEGWSGYSDFRIVASHTDPMWLGPFPLTLNVYICGSYDCLQKYDRWNWSTQNPWHAGDDQPLYEGSCQVIPPCSSGCSYITVEPSGTGTYVPNCGTTICFHNQSGSSVGSFILNFDPPLDPTKPCPSTSGGSVPCNTYINGNTYTPDPSWWDITNVDPDGNVTFTRGTGATCANCGSVCVTIPRCVAGPYKENVSLVSPINPPTCSSDNTFIIVDMKKADGTLSTMSGDSGSQNYPNPLGAASGFNTTIPFATSTAGEATITIVNEKGVKILTDNEEILGAGSHFFYFSGKDLPSGTYYYTIEFPQGVIIASKTMIVVK
jgi:hypothetical protein